MSESEARQGVRAAIFLDRDGVLNVRPPEHEYVRSPAELRLIDGVEESLVRLRAAGYVLLVVSNQRGVARGIMTQRDLDAIERTIQERLHAAGAEITAFYYCTHDDGEGCECRKPKPGLVVAAARQHGIDTSRSTLIGDSETDVLAGRGSGCRTIRIATPGSGSAADAIVSDLPAAADLILSAAWAL
jgi:D-glycero-D-manno-heptose 1,7-bisphosphate phosphatase